MSDSPKRLTVEEYADLPDDGTWNELINGEIVRFPFPDFRHGLVCGHVLGEFGNNVRTDRLGYACANTGVITSRNPDSVRGADLAFWLRDRVLKPIPQGYFEPPPDIVVEVKSRFDEWPVWSAKIAAFRACGVKIVTAIDPALRQAVHYRVGQPEKVVDASGTLDYTDVLPGLLVTMEMILSRQ